MRIALTFNEKRSACEEDADLDSLDTIGAIARLLASLGHVVTPVEVSGPVEQTIAALRRLAPDLVFNLAEGRHGGFREAFYPALFEHLGLPYTGSSATTLALCLDKSLTKQIVRAAGVPVPGGQLVRDTGELRAVRVPAIVKPNHEGSSKGITQASVITETGDVRRVVGELLARYPTGVLVEDYVDGIDVAVGWVDGLGVLPAIGYAYEPTGPHRIYDLALKLGPPEHIRVSVPAPVSAQTAEALAAAAARAFAALGVTGYGRADFRVTASGDLYFLEMNPLPSLEPRERDLYLAAAHVGTTARELLARIVAAAVTSPAASPTGSTASGRGRPSPLP